MLIGERMVKSIYVIKASLFWAVAENSRIMLDKAAEKSLLWNMFLFIEYFSLTSFLKFNFSNF